MSLINERCKLATTALQYKKLGLKKDLIEAWEDGMRTTGESGTYEWWYFDAHLNDGSKLVIGFYTKDVANVDTSLNPVVTINLDLSDGRHISKTIYSNEKNDFLASKNTCDVRIGLNTFKGDLHTYHIHVQDKDICVDITLIGEVPAWRPETGHIFFGNNNEYLFAWLPAVPQGGVNATLTFDNRTIQTSGIGYHDHNWGNTSMLELMNHWYWGRAKIGNYTVIAAFICAEKKYGYKKIPIFMLAKNNKIIVNNAKNIKFSLKDIYSDPACKKPVANTIEYAYKKDDLHFTILFSREKTILVSKFTENLSWFKKLIAKIIGFDAAYLRFSGKAQIKRIRGKKVMESQKESAMWELMYFGKTPKK